MSSHYRSHAAAIRSLLFVCLLCSASSLKAQLEGPRPASPTTQAPSQSEESSDDSELKLQNYQLKHAKAADVLKLFKQLHGVENVATIDERTNSIVFLANETSARELRESLALLDIETTSPIMPPTPVVQGSSAQAPVPAKSQPLPAKSKPTGPFRKFTFKHAKVADVVKILRELTGANIDNENMEGFAVDERTNSVIWKVGDEWESRHWEETLLALDGESSASNTQSVPSPYAPPASMPTPINLTPTPNSQVSAPPTQTFTFSLGVERGESLESLKQRYSELEQQTHELADKLKQSKSPSGTERNDLQAAVRKSFEARQALQRAELADLAGRLKSMQQSIDMRDKLADKVIERRVEDLLNPNLKWDLLAGKERTLEGTNSESRGAIATTAQSATNISSFTPGGSASLPPSMAPAPTSVPYDPGKRPETIIMERIQGHWVAESMLSAGKNSLSDFSEPFEVLITGNEMRFRVGLQDLYGPMLLTGLNVSYRSIESADQPLPVDIVIDPNGEHREMPGIIACNGSTLSLCFAEQEESQTNGFRPTSFIPGSKVVVIKCYRPTPTVPGIKPIDADLSTPQATIDYLHRHSLAYPGGFPAECYTDEALLELSGMLLQNLSMMSAMSQIALQTGGVIGESSGVPVVSDISPAFHILVETLLKEQMLPTPPESADKAFELLATLTFGSTSSSAISSVQVDRQLLRLAAGVLKSPKEFLPLASALLNPRETDADVAKSQKANQAQPKADIAVNGDEATATITSSGNVASTSPLSAPRVTKLRRIDGRWLISEILSDQEITQLQSSYSSVMEQLGGAEEVRSDVPKAPDSSQRKNAAREVESSKTEPPEWNDFLKLLPESGTALVMFSDEPETKEQMLPVAKKVAEAASAQLIELPITTWHKIIAPPAMHFVLMKDRQLVGIRTGLITETRLRDFVSKAKNWLTPQSTGIAENSLVRIDCFINPGPDNIGSQHGGAYPMTTAVVAVHEDQALLFGPESIAEYIEKGYACVAIVRDASGNQKQVPMDVLLNGPVKLLGRSEKQPKSAASTGATLGDGDFPDVPLAGVAIIYPKSVTELLEAYDVGTAIYHIRGVQGLKPVGLAAIKDAPIVNQRVLSGSFRRERHVPPLHGFRSPIYWQSQIVPKTDGHIYGDNINGAGMFEVLCPARPAPCGFTFNEHGRLIGMYGLGEPSEKDMTHTVFKPDTTHSVLQAALDKIDDTGLKTALADTLEESHKSLKSTNSVR